MAVVAMVNATVKSADSAEERKETKVEQKLKEGKKTETATAAPTNTTEDKQATTINIPKLTSTHKYDKAEAVAKPSKKASGGLGLGLLIGVGAVVTVGCVLLYARSGETKTDSDDKYRYSI
jgi:hypothetical protein